MIRTTAAYSVLTSMALTLAIAGPAAAQATRTWVSGVGDDANPCSRTAPCKTFAGAISKTAAGGEISVLDPGGYGAVTITKSISITNDKTGEAGILAAGTSGVIINALDTDFINLRGLVIDGVGTGLNGVRVMNAGSVTIQDTVIRNFRSGSASGVVVNPAAGKTIKVAITDSLITRNGVGTGGGVLVAPLGNGGKAKVVIERSSLIDNIGFGLKADGVGSDSTGNVTVVLHDSLVAGSIGSGVLANSGAGKAPVAIMVDGSSSSNNTLAGFRTTSGNTNIRIGRSTATGNGDAGLSTSGGIISTYGTNQSDGNVVADSVLTPIAPK